MASTPPLALPWIEAVRDHTLSGELSQIDVQGAAGGSVAEGEAAVAGAGGMDVMHAHGQACRPGHAVS
jgi:hypothetical protein